jgi:hypothetical protein
MIKESNIIIFLLVLYGCDTWYLTLREERRLKLLHNRVLERISGPERGEVTSWRKLHDEELHNLHSSPDIIRGIRSKWTR